MGKGGLITIIKFNSLDRKCSSLYYYVQKILFYGRYFLEDSKMKYAVIRTGGKQYQVSEGQQLKIEKLPTEVGKNIEFDDVLLTVDEGKIQIGKPKVAAKVSATVVDQIRGPKISVFKYKAKTGYHKKTGHRQSLTVVKIEKIAV